MTSTFFFARKINNGKVSGISDGFTVRKSKNIQECLHSQVIPYIAAKGPPASCKLDTVSCLAC